MIAVVANEEDAQQARGWLRDGITRPQPSALPSLTRVRGQVRSAEVASDACCSCTAIDAPSTKHDRCHMLTLGQAFAEAPRSAGEAGGPGAAVAELR